MADVPANFSIELAPFFTEGACMGPNLRTRLMQACFLSAPVHFIDNNLIRNKERPPCGHCYVPQDIPAKCTPEEETLEYSAARSYLAQTITSEEFISPSNPLALKWSPFSDEGVYQRILKVVSEVCIDAKDESARLESNHYRYEFVKKSNEKALASTRNQLGINGWNPRQGQPKFDLFTTTLAESKISAEVVAAAEAHAAESTSLFLKEKISTIPVEKVTKLIKETRDRLGSLEGVARMLFAQVQEVTHASATLVNFNGQSIPYGRNGICRASPGCTRCPSVHHASRAPPYMLLRQLWATGRCQRLLGIRGDSHSIFMCGMPPFFAGDRTAGESYCLGGDTAQLAFLGDQNNDGGFHFSWYNRRDAVSIALSADTYVTPDLEIMRDLVERSLTGQQFYLFGLGWMGPTLKLEICTEELKIVQGQKRNGPPAGGHGYIAWAIPPAGIAIVKAARITIMPTAPEDVSFSPHLSGAMLGPSQLPHLKSPYCLEVAGKLARDGADMSAVWKAFFEVHEKTRALLTPAATQWDTYETAAAAMGANKTSNVLLEVLGFKAIVASEALATTDCLPDTVYAGPRSSKALRDHKLELGPLLSATGLQPFDVKSSIGVALSFSLTAATFYTECANEAEQKEVVVEMQKLMRSVGASALLLPAAF